MPENAREIIEREFSNSISELFEFYAEAAPDQRSLNQEETENPLGDDGKDYDRQRDMVSSSIGLGAEDFRSSIGLLAHVETVIALCGGELDCPTDWIGELANQLIGRMKNNLSEYNVTAQMGMPVSVRGVQMGFTVQAADQIAVSVDTSVGRVVALLHLQIEPSVAWERDPEMASAEEGSLCFF